MIAVKQFLLCGIDGPASLPALNPAAWPQLLPGLQRVFISDDMEGTIDTDLIPDSVDRYWLPARDMDIDAFLQNTDLALMHHAPPSSLLLLSEGLAEVYTSHITRGHPPECSIINGIWVGRAHKEAHRPAYQLEKIISKLENST